MLAINGSILAPLTSTHRLGLILILLLSLIACGGGGTDAAGDGVTTIAGQANGGWPHPEGTPPLEMSVSINQMAPGSYPQVKAYVAVTDAQGRPIEALTSEDFSIYANGELAQGVRVQWVAETTTPVSVSFVMDYSGGMTVEAIGRMEGAASAFVDQMSPNDWGEVIKFALLGEIVQAYTSDKAALKTAINEPWRLSSPKRMLYDAVHRAVNDTAQREGRRAVLAITDGIDNASRHTLEELIAFATENNVPVFTVGLNPADTDSLTQLAAGTGGRYFYAPDPSALAGIYAQLAALLKHQYVVSYSKGTSPNPEHTLEVIAESDSQVAGDILWVSTLPVQPSLQLAGRMAAGEAASGMAIMEVNAPKPPILDSDLSTLAHANGFAALDVAASSPYAFIAAGEKGLVIADVSTADAPRIVSTISPTQILTGPHSTAHLTAFTAVAAAPPFIFALDETDGIVVLRFQDPQHISYQVETGVKGNGIWVTNTHVYVTTATGLSIYDIADPSQPRLVGQAAIQGGGDAITLALPYAYVALKADKGVAVIDVSRDTDPTVLGTLMTDSAISDIEDQNGFAFAGSIEEGDLDSLAPDHSQIPKTLG